MTSNKAENTLKHQYILNDPLHQLFDSIKAISVQGYDEERRVIYWNEGSEILYGYTQEEASGQKLEDLIIPDPVKEFVITSHSDWLNKDIEIPASDITLRHKDGSDVSVFSSHVMFTNQFNTKQMYCIDVDLTEVKQAQAQVIFKEHMLESIFEAIPDLFFLMDYNGTIVDYHASNLKNLLVSPEHFVGKNMADVIPLNVAKEFKVNIEKLKQKTEMVSFEYDLTLPHGVTHFEARMSHLSKYNQVVVIIRDITEQHKSAELIRHQAYFDNLTSLPNRALALDRLSQMLIEAKRNSETSAVLFVDIDDFKKVNDSLGHEIGDTLLVQASNRLQQSLREQDTVGRLGGDEFIVLISDLGSHQNLLAIAENLLKNFRKPFSIDDKQLMLTISIGVALYPDDGESPSDLLRNADTAMYQAKNMGRNTYSFFTPEMNIMMQRRLQIEEQMRSALERHEFEVFYQPQFDVKNKTMIGAEALLRWHNPNLGHVSPEEFIPIAEHTGLIVPIGQFVIAQALNFLSKWQDTQQHTYTMSVNLSPRQFRDIGLIDFIKEALVKERITPESLELEITEGVLMTGQSYIYDALAQIKALGIKIAMDDFGTGYSSISYLRQYSFDVLKIDRSFISGITENKADCDLVKATIAMSHSLGLSVIAEGVETKQQLSLLDDLGCEFVQGFYLSKPLPKNQLLDFSTQFYS
ncbi:bifunctional diguanylate cyclase/phosphodiesterase [uncultured Paraglaciecola sp.]|uniref:sensor domain-containing protein n=1 Tax=uncultured Paraglaciecola sp. TaxID=1765024 RepID=UPI0026020ED9|nr:bifunctional diguanylate cyclase/phosphodiesterase [uncultured Paraglaciecola sp.]